MKLIDISSDLLTAPVYPGDPEPRLHVVSRIANGDECNLSALYACLHTGTHADAPMHFIEGGKSISEMPLECFIGPCTVLEIEPGPVTGEQIDALVKPGCERVLFKSGGGAYFLESAGDELAMLGVRLVGTDAQSVGCPGNQARPHRALLQENIAVLEGLCLEAAPPGDYFLIAPPVKIVGRDGAPVRAVLASDYIFWGGGRIKYEAINAAKSCLWPLIREGIVTSIVIFRQNN